MTDSNLLSASNDSSWIFVFPLLSFIIPHHRLIGQHKKDLALNENKHKEKIRQKENDFERVCLTRLEEQRNCMLRERDSVIEQERDMAAARTYGVRVIGCPCI